MAGLNMSLKLQVFEAHRISRPSTNEGCQLYAPAAFTLQEIHLVLMSVRG
jgi:hypothetical protein